MEAIMSFACLGAGGAFVLLIFFLILKQFLYICKPNEVLIISGRGRKDQVPGGTVDGYQPVFFGRVWRKPFLEKVASMDLRSISIDISVGNAYSKGGIPLKVHAVANVKITNSPKFIMNGVERFLGRDQDEVKRVAKETMEGHLRGVLARLTPEEVNEDRLKFANELVNEAQDDFERLGLQLDALKIQHVADDVKYLDSIGRERIANVKRDAEIAESNARSEAELIEASANQAAQVASQTAEMNIVQKANAVRQYRAEQEALAKSEEERMTQIVAQARAEAEVKLQEIRQKVEKARLEGEVILPAQARQQAEALRARGEAASIAENGLAMAQVLELMTQAWLRAGDDAKDIFLIQQIEGVLRTVVERVRAIGVDDVVLLDSGDGKALAAYAAAYPAMVASVLQELKATTGIDIVGTLSGNRADAR